MIENDLYYDILLAEKRQNKIVPILLPGALYPYDFIVPGDYFYLNPIGVITKSIIDTIRI